MESSANIQLRPLEPEDLELLYTIENSPEMWDSSDSDTLYSRFTLKQYIAANPSFFESGNLRLTIVWTDNETAPCPVGIIDLTNYSPFHARAEVGIALLRQYRGRHIASQALSLIEHIASSRFRIHSLHAFVSSSNTPCHHLFLSAEYSVAANLPQWHYTNHHYEDATLYVKILSDAD